MKFLFIFLNLILFTSCDPEVLIPNEAIKLVKASVSNEKLAFKNIFIDPIQINYDNKKLVSQVNKVAIKNINNFTDLKIFFNNQSKQFSNLEHFSLEIRIFKSIYHDIEFRIFENKFKTLVYKKIIPNVKDRSIISETEKELRQIFKIQLKKYKSPNKISYENN